MGRSGPQSNTCFFGPTRVQNPNGIMIGSAVFAGLTSVADRPTDHATRSVTIGRIYVRSTAMRPKKTSKYGARSAGQWPINRARDTARHGEIGTTLIRAKCRCSAARTDRPSSRIFVVVQRRSSAHAPRRRILAAVDGFRCRPGRAAGRSID